MSQAAVPAEEPLLDSPTPESPTEAARPAWWSGPGGGAEVMSVAGPLIVSTLSWTINTFVDRMLLNHWSGSAMSAAFVASTAWFALVCLPLGICAYVGTFVAQYHGAGKPKRIGPSVWQGVWIALAASPLVLLAIPFASPMFALAGHDAQLIDLESRYFSILCVGAPAMLVAQSTSCFFSGRGKTAIVMTVDALFAGFNLLLDWWWIFGLSVTLGGESYEVFPAMGIDGAGWATTLSMWLKMIVFFVLMLRKENRVEFATHSWKTDRALLRRMLYFGTPSGVQTLLDVLGFTAFIVLIGRLGPVANEATSMTFSIGSVAFMPVVGLGIATSILVGQHLGENRDRDASRATWTALHVAWGYMAVVSTLFVFTPWLFLGGFFTGEAAHAGSGASREAVAAMAIVLMRFVAAYNFMDAMLIVFISALKGAGDTQFVLYTSLVMAALLAALSWLAVEVLDANLYGCWALVSCWITGLGLVFFARFMQGRWRTMRVIEPELAA